MPPHHALSALKMRPVDFLRSAWPWRSAVYLAGGIVVGLATVLSVTTLLVTGALLSFVVVGTAAYLATVLAGVAVGQLERWRLRLVDDDPLPDPHAPPPRSGVRAWVLLRLGEQATWRELGFTMLSAAMLCWIDMIVLGGALFISFSMILGPFYIDDSDLLVTVPIAIAGLAFLTLMAYPITAWAGARAALARAILAPRNEEADMRLVEVTRSRARLVDAFEVERRRIERDLHDGAQQRLVALSMKLGMARLELPVGTPAAEHVASAQDLAKQALTELRELIRGVHPKVLTDRGLEAAVSDVVADIPMAVDVRWDLPQRLPASVEVTAYFVIVEALTNVVKHSGAARAAVSGELSGGRFILEVTDDGHGGADPRSGSGLVGLADRTAAVDGMVAIRSPPGGPTVVRAEIPVLL